MDSPSAHRRGFRLLVLILILVVPLVLVLCGLLFLAPRLVHSGRPTVVEVVAQFPGASAEEVERQVTIPLEVTFAGIPGMKSLRSKSLFGIACVELEFDARVNYADARQEVINRLATISQPLPASVIPAIASTSPARFRYTLVGPKNAAGQDIYTLNDLRALQDWVVEREFRRVPRIVDVEAFGGTVRRYEVQPDPDRLRRYGITLSQLRTLLNENNAAVGGDFANQGNVALSVRSVGLIGGGEDPVQKVLDLKDPAETARRLRSEERRRIRDIRQLVITKINGTAVHVGDVVDGGPLLAAEELGMRGVIVGNRPRKGRVALSRQDADSRWVDQDDVVEGVVCLRQGEDREAAWRDVQAKIDELNAGGRLLPGVRIEPYFKDGGGQDCFWIHVHLLVNVSIERAEELLGSARERIRGFGEVDHVVSELGAPEDGSTPRGLHVARILVRLAPAKAWPPKGEGSGTRTKTELMDEIRTELEYRIPGVHWDCSLNDREGLHGEITGTPEEPVLKIFGPDMDRLEKLATQAKTTLQATTGVENVTLFQPRGAPHLEFRIDPEKCRKWGVMPADVNNVVQTALGVSQTASMIEGEKSFDITVRWPEHFRGNEQAILDLPVDIAAPADEPQPGPNALAKPRLRLRDLVSAVDGAGPDPKGDLWRSSLATIYRENGKRLILLRLSLRGRSLNAIRADVTSALSPLPLGYRLEWDGGR